MRLQREVPRVEEADDRLGDVALAAMIALLIVTSCGD
jgi:hypothetical protein